ncbi:MAG: Uncharacterized MFS-type transporter, partial [uncultured Acidimicrobiales bacterium]
GSQHRPDQRGRPRPPAPLDDPRRALPEPRHRHPREHGAERGAAHARPGPRRHVDPAPVDGRLLRPGLRRAAPHRRRPRRPLRAQGRPADRPGHLRFRLAALHHRHHRRPPRRHPRPHGRRRRTGDAGHPLHPHQRLPAPGAGEGDRHLGRPRRQRGRHRTHRRRLAARALLVGLGVPPQRARRHRGPRRRPGPRAPLERPRPPAPRPEGRPAVGRR